MATVVTMLLNQAQADVAVFGEKDYQQLLIVRRLVRDLAIPTEIVGGRTVREGDGLAMSSRNLLLTPEHRHLAPTLHRVLTDTAAGLADGRLAAPVLQLAAESLQKSGFRDVDYVELRDAETLAPLAAVGGRPARVLGAAFLGPVRLIDNVPVMSGSP
jgi:pantoate--beta-alanine ligase